MTTKKKSLPEVPSENSSTSVEPELARTEKAEGFTEFYFNHAQCGYTPFDVYAYLSEALHDSDRKLVIRQKARVTMSPIEAMLLARFLTNCVATYESVYGKVNLPPDVRQQLES